MSLFGGNYRDEHYRQPKRHVLRPAPQKMLDDETLGKIKAIALGAALGILFNVWMFA